MRLEFQAFWTKVQALEERTVLKPGDIAPDFVANDHLGKQHALSDYKGKSLVIWFYPQADTPGWTAEGCGFRDLKSEFDKKNAAILGCSFDSEKDNAAFAEKFTFNFPLLSDPDRMMALAYGAADAPDSDSAKRVGVIIGPDGKVAHYFPKVKAKDFPQEALKLL